MPSPEEKSGAGPGRPEEEEQPHSSVALAQRYGACSDYQPPISLVRGAGVWVWDTDNRKYLDLHGAQGALNQGHRHQRILKALEEQCERLTLTSRAFHNDQLGRFLRRLSEITGCSKALPLTSGAQAVEAALKASRRWGYHVRGVPDGGAEIIVCEGNHHGGTSTLLGCQTETEAREGFGPFAPGFVTVPFGDLDALREAVTPRTVAFLVEPVQVRAGVRLPPPGYLSQACRFCQKEGILFIVDEITTGLGRTGNLLALHQANLTPDLIILGQALGGGVYPVAAVCGSEEILGVFRPWDNATSYGGSPLAAAVGTAALNVIVEEDLPENARVQGDWLLEALQRLRAPSLKEVRGRGLLLGLELEPAAGSAADLALELLSRGLLTHPIAPQVLLLAPPLVVTRADLEFAIEELQVVLQAWPSRG